MACADIQKGETICCVRRDGKRTPAGRFTNHSGKPNAKMFQDDLGIHLRALRDISGSRGGQDGEEITVDYRQAFAVNKASVCQA